MDGADDGAGFAQIRRVEGQQDGQHMDLGGRRREMAAVGDDLPGVRALQQAEGPGIGFGQPGGKPLPQDGADRTRKDRAVDQRGAQDSEDDFLDPGHGDIEHEFGVSDGWKGDQRRGIAGQHHDIGPRRAIEQGNAQADTDPDRQGQAKQHRRVDQKWYREDGESGPQQCAEHAINPPWIARRRPEVG